MKHPCITWWPEKFLASTADMTPDGAAYYRLLLDHAWVRGGSLPNDDNKLRLMTRLSIYRWRGLREEILGKFTLGKDGRWHHPRMDTEWQRAEERYKKREGLVSEATKVFAKTNGKKPNKINGAPPSPARARPSDPTPTSELSVSNRESSEGDAQSNSQPAAPLRVGHATRPAQNGADPMEPPDDIPADERARIAEGLAKLAASLTSVDKPQPDSRVTDAKRERLEALAKLEEIAKAAPLPKLSSDALKAIGVDPPTKPRRQRKQFTQEEDAS